MADKKISALTAATTPLAGTEVLPIVQSGSTVKIANNDLRPKQIQSNATSGVLQVVGPAAAATRVMTVPDADFTAVYSGGPLGTPSSGALTNCTFPAGMVVNVVNSTLATFKNTTSTSFVDTTLAASITPKTNTNTVLVTVTLNGCSGTGGAVGHFILTDTSGNQLSAIANLTGDFNASLTFLHSPATTSAYTYKVYYKQSGGTAVYLNNYGATANGTVSSITLMEIVA